MPRIVLPQAGVHASNSIACGCLPGGCSTAYDATLIRRDVHQREQACTRLSTRKHLSLCNSITHACDHGEVLCCSASSTANPRLERTTHAPACHAA